MEENEPVYFELADALELYAAIIGGTTGQAADQLRDQAGLESALGRPRNYAHYQEADLALQAAALFPIDLTLDDEEQFRERVETVARYGGILGGLTFLGEAPGPHTENRFLLRGHTTRSRARAPSGAPDGLPAGRRTVAWARD